VRVVCVCRADIRSYMRIQITFYENTGHILYVNTYFLDSIALKDTNNTQNTLCMRIQTLYQVQ
jgi:hypothetical protein